MDEGVLSAPGDQMGFCQAGDPEWLEDRLTYSNALRHGLLQQRQALRHRPVRYGQSRGRAHAWEPERYVAALAQSQAAFERRDEALSSSP